MYSCRKINTEQTTSNDSGEILSLSLIQLFHTEITNSSHNGLPFSTFDVDNDNREGDFSERSCARLYKVRLSPNNNIFSQEIIR